MPLASGEQIGQYKILSLIGAGGMGEVYRARDLTLKREVALKVLPATFLRDADRMARFQREAEVLASLEHPNIGHIYGIVDAADSRALVLALVEGPTLADRIGQGSLPVEESVAIAKQVIEALEYAHERGVVHRDLKPANIKITPEGIVKVLDFGLAKVLEDEPPKSSLGNSPTLTLGHTRVGMILGTAAYMSPEQAVGRPVDRRTDIFSFGSVLYEMFTGKRAFGGETTPDVLEAVVKTDPDWSKLPPETPAALRTVLRRSLVKDRKQRLQSIGEARIILEATAEEPLEATARAFPWIWPIAVAVLLAALAALSLVHFREKPPENATLRYSLTMPLNLNANSFAISPDGKYLVIAALQNGSRQLYLRGLDSLELRLMASTNDARYPFWSPDSRQIGFFADGKLRKIPVSGGPSQVLADAPDPRGGAWNRDNIIVFEPTVGASSLKQVPAAGGQATEFLKTKANRRFPVFLPDGRHFLYQMGGTAEISGIYVASLDGAEDRKLLSEFSPSVFAPSPDGGHTGHLLFLRESNLMAQPFDVDSRQLQGEAFPVAAGLSLRPNAAWMPASASDRGTLVFEGGSPNTSVRQIAWYDRSGKFLANVGSPGIVFAPSLSPDQKTMAYQKGVSGGFQNAGAELWLRDLARETDTRLTSDPSVNFGPVWSPNGDRIAFSSNRGAKGYNLFQRASNGTGQDEPVITSVESQIVSQWSRDGQYLVYENADVKTGADLWVFPIGEAPAADRKPRLFLKTEFNEYQGQISPDGHWMAYTSNSTGSNEVFVQPFPTGEGKWKISTAGGTQARWRGDSKELYYVAADNKIMAVAAKASVSPKISFEPGTPQALFDSHMLIDNRVHQYDVTSDGQRFLINVDPVGASAQQLIVVVNWSAANHATR